MGILLKRFGFALLFLVLCFGLASAQVYQITTHTIQIEIDELGEAEIIEKFFLSFPNDFHLQSFREETQKLGVDLVAWQQFNPSFKPSIGSVNEAEVSDIGFFETESKYLEIQYTLNEPIVNKVRETTRMVEFSLNSKFFNDFIEGSLWVIPSNLTIIVDAPPQAEIQTPVKPEANITGNRVVWTGYKSTNVLELRFVIFKQIASLNLNEIVEAVMDSDIFPLVIVVAVLAVIAFFWKRKPISARIEGYIIQHSDLSNMEEED